MIFLASLLIIVVFLWTIIGTVLFMGINLPDNDPLVFGGNDSYPTYDKIKTFPKKVVYCALFGPLIFIFFVIFQIVFCIGYLVTTLFIPVWKWIFS